MLEANLDRGRGPVATVLVRNGTLKIGDFFICGSVFGKVRAMFDDRGNQMTERRTVHSGGGPRARFTARGRRYVPGGDRYREGQADRASTASRRRAKPSLAEERRASPSNSCIEHLREGESQGTQHHPQDRRRRHRGSAQPTRCRSCPTTKSRSACCSIGVGAINESDVLLASTSDAIIIGFNVRPERNAATLAEEEKVDVRLHTIIYDLTDEIEARHDRHAGAGLQRGVSGPGRSPRRVPHHQGGHGGGLHGAATASSRATAKCGCCAITSLSIPGKVDSLKRFKNDVSEVKSGFECGMTITGYNDIKPADIIEAFVTERVAPEAVA